MLYGCGEKTLGEHGFTKTDFENGWFSIKLKYEDKSIETIEGFHGIGECNSYGFGYMHAQKKYFGENMKVKEYVCCYVQKDPECKIELR